MYLDSVACTGTEVNLADCPATTSPSCSHNDDAGIRCGATRESVKILSYISTVIQFNVLSLTMQLCVLSSLQDLLVVWMIHLVE